MAYSAEITSSNPRLIVFLINQARSMAVEAPGLPSQTKAAAVADAINLILDELLIRCTRGEHVENYFNVCVVGYGHRVGPAFSGLLSGREIITIKELATKPTRIAERMPADRGGSAIEQEARVPIWIDAVANGGTPMRNVFAYAHTVVQQWLEEHPDCFPPVVIHIADGQSTDGDPTQLMKALADLCSSDGNVILFNIHISRDASSRPIAFPDSRDNLPSRFAEALFDCASPLTDELRMVAHSDYDTSLPAGARGCVIDGDISLVLQAMDIGTRSG